MPRRTPKIIHHLICDDIREEVGNKFSFIGVYKGNALFTPIPTMLPKLCFHITFHYVKSGDALELKLLDPDNKVIAGFPLRHIDIPKKKKVRTVALDVAFGGVNITREGVYRLVLIFGEEDKTEQEIKIEMKKIQPQKQT